MKGLLLIVLLAAYTLADDHLPGESGNCGCCPNWCDCLCEETNKTGLEIAVVHDSSGSISAEDWILSKTVVAAILCGIRCPNNKVAHISYATNVEPNWNLNSAIGMSFEQTLAELIVLPQIPVGATNTVGALQLVLDDVFNGMDNPDKPNIVLVLTDGMATANPSSLKDVADQVHLIAKTLAIGISDHIDEQELADIASGSGDDNVFICNSMDNLPTLVPDIINAINDMFPCQPKTQECVCCCPPPKPHYYRGWAGCGCGGKNVDEYRG